MVVALDRAGSVIFANGRWASYRRRAAAYALDAVRAAITRRPHRLRYPAPGHARERGERKQAPVRLRRHDSGSAGTSCGSARVLDDDGREPLAYVGIAVDIHDREGRGGAERGP
ncbi:MAG: hypothetical protein IPG47_14715 [Thermoflexaceae bacterium]|nr:hypothetical protein [Thermoflexaceae bacterium]